MKMETNINSFEDLVTSKSETRKGFKILALRKAEEATFYSNKAKKLRKNITPYENLSELKENLNIRSELIECAGISTKTKSRLDDESLDEIVNEFLKKFIKPEGKFFKDEIINRFMLTQGDALGGRMRNIAGRLAAEKLNKFIYSIMRNEKIESSFFHRKKKIWVSTEDEINESLGEIKAIKWNRKNKKRLLIYDLTVPIVKKNIDIVIFNNDQCGEISSPIYKSFIKENKNYLALGELKGGIDPAGADEHWKTANTALDRIRNSFNTKNINVLTFFIGAAIERSMAEEIYYQLNSKKLSNCANLTKKEQLKEICKWLISI